MISTYQFRMPTDAAGRDAAAVAADRGNEWSACGEMVGAIKEIVHHGNVKRISIADAGGKTLIELPHLLGARGGPRMEPIWAALDALARVAGNLTIRVDRDEGWPEYEP